jgi:protein required for attachment to host cells
MPHVRPKTTWAAIADGGKALILVNEGTDKAPVLRVAAKSEIETPPTRAQGADKPGRRPDTGSGQRSAMETTDWHEFEQSRFVEGFAERLNKAAALRRFERLILIAPPRVLGQLRAALDNKAANSIIAEIGSDLTKHPVEKIETHIAKALGG